MSKESRRTAGRPRVRPPCYRTWINIRRWCGVRGTRQNRYYDGVTVCDEWVEDYAAFEEWCLSHGWRKGLFLVRIDKNGDFSPANCRIVSAGIANGMRRCVRRMADGRSARDIIGREDPSADREYHNRVARRIFDSKWDVESAMSVPVMGKFRTKAQKERNITR